MMARLLLIGLLLIGLGMAAEAKLYKWVDADGSVHFTDNPSNIPASRRNNAEVGEMPQLNVVDSEAASAGGSGLFAEKCAACHVAGYDADGERLPLLAYAVDPDTGLKRTVEDLAAELRWAADGRLSDMAPVEVSDEELREIAAFLLQRAETRK